MKKLMLFTGLLSACFSGKAQSLTVYPVPQGIYYARHNDDFTVQARLAGGSWQDLYEYRVVVDGDNPQPASMVQFDFEGEVEVRVRVNNGEVRSVALRPAHRGVQPQVEGSVIRFTLSRPAKLSLEVNGDRLHNLHIFANEPEKEAYREGDAGVMYFGAGMHQPKDGKSSFDVPSNTVVYLAPGAIVQGKFVCSSVENVRFLGRGFLLEPQRGFEILHSRNVAIDGLTVINPTHYTVFGGQSEGITVRNLKSFSCKGWSDGIDLMSCSEVDIRDVFMRNSDDCIAIYAHRWDYYGNARGYRVSNAILWADVAHPINIGLHGNAAGSGDTIENLRFLDVDILEHDEDDRSYQGCIAFSVGDKNLVQNATFENIRVEHIQEGQLFNLRVLYNEKYSAAPGRGIKNVAFKNVTYSGLCENPSIVEGYDERHAVSTVSFENITLNGRRAKTLSEAGITLGKHASGITIK